MSKDKYYFPHDSNARHDPKITAMRSVYGAEGYGWYWILLELMREQDGYLLPINTKYSYLSLAQQMGCDKKSCTKFITDCLEEFDLFERNEDYFWSASFLSRMQKVDELRQTRRDAINSRWDKVRAKKESKDNKSKTTNEGKDIKSREATFKEEIRGYVDKYGVSTVKEFFDYWTEPNTSKTKMRFEQEKTWSTSRRLTRWANNNKSFKGKSNDKGLTINTHKPS